MCLEMMPSWCRQVNWGNCGITWVNCAVLCVWKTTEKDSSQACVCLSKLRSWLSFSIRYDVTQYISCDVDLLNGLLETDVSWDGAIVVWAGNLRELWDSLSELCSCVRERRLEKTVVRPALLPVKTAQFTQFFRPVWSHTIKSLSLTAVYGAL